MDDLFWFWSTSAQMSVVLLGFWWAIVTFKHEEWMADPALKRIASWISLHFLLPGVMSLASLLAIENSLLWRTEFVLGGIGGAVASVMSGIYARRARIPPVLGGWGWKALMVLYLLIAVVAVSGPRLLTALSIEQKPWWSRGCWCRSS